MLSIIHYLYSFSNCLSNNRQELWPALLASIKWSKLLTYLGLIIIKDKRL
jgi:hypothetical protein